MIFVKCSFLKFEQFWDVAVFVTKHTVKNQKLLKKWVEKWGIPWSENLFLKKVFPKAILNRQPEYREELSSEFAKKCNKNCPIPKLYGQTVIRFMSMSQIQIISHRCITARSIITVLTLYLIIQRARMQTANTIIFPMPTVM